MKAFGALGSVVALGLLCLANAGGAATASAASAPAAHPAPAVALGVPGSFRPAAASFVSPAWGVVLGSASRAYRAQLAVTADGGAHSGNVQAVAASANAVYAVAGNHLYRSPL